MQEGKMMQKTDISHLLEIQKLENKIMGHLKNIDSHSSRMKNLEKQISTKKNCLQSTEIKINEQKNLLLKKENELHLLGEKKQKSDEHFKRAKSEQQVKALEKELKDMLPQIEHLEDDILSLMETIELKEKEIIEINTFLEGSAKSYSDIEKEVKEDIHDDKYAINVFEKKEKNLLENCSSEAKDFFLSLKNRYKYKGFVSLIQKGRCSKCFFTIPPMLQQTVRKETSLECCPGCQRLLTPDQS
jgi:chromosome segregation protein